MIKHHFNKENLHHAYLIEGERESITQEITSFLESIDMKIINNPDVVQIHLDSFKVDNARTLKSYATERGLSEEKNAKRIFIISANNFLLEAQNSLLKLFEEPIHNTHFFIVVPDTSTFIKTLISRFYVITNTQDHSSKLKGAEEFITMTPKARIDFLKELLTEDEDEDESVVATDSIRSKSLQFLNMLESTLHSKMSKSTLSGEVFDHIFNVRKYLRQPGSSPKTLMESVALITPSFSK